MNEEYATEDREKGFLYLKKEKSRCWRDGKSIIVDLEGPPKEGSFRRGVQQDSRSKETGKRKNKGGEFDSKAASLSQVKLIVLSWKTVQWILC